MILVISVFVCTALFCVSLFFCFSLGPTSECASVHKAPKTYSNATARQQTAVSGACNYSIFFDYETVGILPLISRKTLGILGDGGLVKACVA